MYTFREGPKGAHPMGQGPEPYQEWNRPHAPKGFARSDVPETEGTFHPQVDGTAPSSLLFDLDSQ